ncbi:MAG TPA: sigma-70 family RNA polymerase sigma factor, partial [Gemmatimonadaceae bacterium]|nr:sigma-70 family RNA polymerase sigma factor [Gemmatimonadaceae bacterium]
MTSPSRPDDRPVADPPAPGAVPETISDQEFETLLVDMLDRSYRLALRLTGDSQDAEDLVQEAALRAFRFRHSFQRGTSFKAWFYRIIVNYFYTTTRRKRVATTSLDDPSEANDVFLFRRSGEAGLLRPDADP